MFSDEGNPLNLKNDHCYVDIVHPYIDSGTWDISVVQSTDKQQKQSVGRAIDCRPQEKATLDLCDFGKATQSFQSVILSSSKEVVRSIVLLIQECLKIILKQLQIRVHDYAWCGGSAYSQYSRNKQNCHPCPFMALTP